MKKQFKTLLAAAAVVAAPLLISPAASAADYPSRPVKFVVPWPPGDLEDLLTRLIAEEMTNETGKPATVVNKPGGGGIIGAADVANTPPNGLTIGSFVVDIVSTYVAAGNAPYDKDTFEPVGIFLDYPFVIATKSDAPYNNLKELAEYSKTHDVSLGHFGYQALPTALTFKAAMQEGIKFKSDAPFDSIDCSTLATGDADIINTTTQTILACLKSGEVKVIASITNERIGLAPDVPTLAEQTGIKQTLWNGLFVKKGTPAEIKARIAEVAKAALEGPRAAEIAKTTGAGIYWTDGAAAEQRVADDFEASKELLKFMK
ncbi:Tricarboxylate transport protein TctC [Marinobacterium lacunae]|uniref:Tricarboxylate transport protein TctC n=1 Tax=Marinobacterium lacunae TaxID=1232683 RepID=A0A081G372_9GAMM|nr:tripartite tricarboxylate transporter substrate binding protein [Marinobacterium lacunae]KEA65227.1 Tricarboxylate transport protein TctC [Marinobacterium lacunae]